MTTTAIARRHGHTGPTNCQDCGTPDNVHFGSWADPATGGSGNFLQCCACGIKAGDLPIDHADCAPGEPDTDNDESGPVVRVFHRPAGWLLPYLSPDVQGCTANFHRAQDGRPPCTGPAVWKAVEEHESADGFPMLSIGFYCDADLPAEHRPPTPA